MRWLALSLSAALGGCSSSDGFGCSEDAQCGGEGVCAAPGYCAFPEPACDSGLIFGAHAGMLAGDCVPPGGGSSATDGGGPVATGTAGAGSSSSSPPGETTLALDEGPASDGATSPDATDSTTDGTGATFTSSDGGDATASDEGSSTGSSPFQVTWIADLALCAYPDNADPAPAQCQAVAGKAAITVDLDETSSGFGAAVGYLAFAVGPEPNGARVLEVMLRLHTSDVTNSNTDHAGEVWLVEAFDAASLAISTPAPIGASPLAADIGAVGIDADAQWSLPTDVLVAGETLHLAIVPISSNGADYLGVGSPSPPAIDATLMP